jgi:hypothetical protein
MKMSVHANVNIHRTKYKGGMEGGQADEGTARKRRSGKGKH